MGMYGVGCAAPHLTHANNSRSTWRIYEMLNANQKQTSHQIHARMHIVQHGVEHGVE